jgi:hypothetical protein
MVTSCIKPKVCEVLQLETKTSSLDYECGIQLFKLYEKQIVRLSKNARDVFTIGNIAIGFANYRYLGNIINNYDTGIRSLKLPLYQNLANPCFLLIVCSKIKNNKSEGISKVCCGSVTLTTILSLASDFVNKKYLPKSIKRIFILRANRKMRPIGIASSQDNIVLQALKFVLAPRFERVFSDFSHGFRSKRNCHSAIKYIYDH